jgi:cell division protein ZapB
MDAELTALEERIRQFAELCIRLRDENQTLRTRLAGLEGDNRKLSDKVETARTRLEDLVRHIPEENV